MLTITADDVIKCTNHTLLPLRRVIINGLPVLGNTIGLSLILAFANHVARVLVSKDSLTCTFLFLLLLPPPFHPTTNITYSYFHPFINKTFIRQYSIYWYFSHQYFHLYELSVLRSIDQHSSIITPTANMDNVRGIDHDAEALRHMAETWSVLQTQISNSNRIISIPNGWFESWTQFGKKFIRRCMK